MDSLNRASNKNTWDNLKKYLDEKKDEIKIVVVGAVAVITSIFIAILTLKRYTTPVFRGVVNKFAGPKPPAAQKTDVEGIKIIKAPKVEPIELKFSEHDEANLKRIKECAEKELDNGLICIYFHKGGVTEKFGMESYPEKPADMWDLLSKKYKNPCERAFLDATGNSYLLNHNPEKGVDSFWSDDSDGTGKNILGRMLMAIRAGEMLSKAEDEKIYSPASTKEFSQAIQNDPHSFQI